MEKNIINEETLKTEFDWLSTELYEANSFYKIACGLIAAIPQYEVVYNDSNTFWYSTHTALMDAAMLRLCRVYDHRKQGNVISLYNLIRHIRDFKEKETIGFIDILDLDKDELYLTNNTNINTLIKWRNNVIAHKSDNLMSKKPFIINDPLKGNIIKELIKGAFEILNRYNQNLYKATVRDTFLDINDYKRVLENINKAISDEFNINGPP